MEQKMTVRKTQVIRPLTVFGYPNYSSKCKINAFWKMAGVERLHP